MALKICTLRSRPPFQPPVLSLWLLSQGLLLAPWLTGSALAAVSPTVSQAGGLAAPPADAPIPLAQLNAPNTDGSSPSLEPQPLPQPLPSLPDPEELLGPTFTPAPPPAISLPENDATVVIHRFQVDGSTVFSQADFDRITADYVDRPITFAEVLEVRDKITQLYQKNDYLTSGAIVPPQALQDGVARIQVVEGSVEDIVVEGTRRLHPSYIRSRLGLGSQTPLQVSQLLKQLQLLQLNPLIDRISADLQAGTQPGTNRLVVTVSEADSFDVGYRFDNSRSPSVGSLRHQFEIREGNLAGYGDALQLDYALTGGSEDFDASYTLPLSPHNTTFTAYFSTTHSDVIEEPFNLLQVSSEATVGELTLRHPLIQTPTEELALGLIASHQRTQTFVGLDDIGGFPLSAGADEQGRTTLTAVRFFQEWTQRSTQQVISLRSQFNLGLGLLGATVNGDPDVPDSRYFSWLGQGQWVRLLAPDTPLLLRGSVQLTPDPLLSLERFGLGGQATVRGYRQDAILTDNGAALSLEGRIPLWRDPDQQALLQLTPFIDGGYGWNSRDPNPDSNGLLGVGTGLRLQVKDATFRVDWGIPLISRSGPKNTLQEQGIYFSVDFTFL